MTNLEFSNEFDILYNNISSNQAPDLNEYEKSVLLTRAQEELIIALYTGTASGISFEETEEIRRYLGNLIVIKEIELLDKNVKTVNGFYHQYIALPKDVLYITYEVADGKLVVPVKQEDYFKTLRNPFKTANSNRSLRLESGKDEEGNSLIELVSAGSKSNRYTIRYIRRPSPIILVNLADNYGDNTINGEFEESFCELHEMVHSRILNRAVQLAKVYYAGSVA